MIPRLLENLRETDEYMRGSSAEALGMLGEEAARHPDVIPRLLEALGDGKESVRGMAAKDFNDLATRLGIGESSGSNS